MDDICCWQSKFVSCFYSDRLLKKLSLINATKLPKDKVNLVEIKKAIYYAKKYHGPQRRQSGEPFYSHPLEVAYMVADYCFKTDLLVTTILHDTIEDTSLTKEIINYAFNHNVGNHVELLTRIRKRKKISTKELVQSLLKHKACSELLLVKYFDRVHNIKTIRAKPLKKTLKIIKETINNFVTVELYLKLAFTNLSQKNNNIAKLCYQYLPSNTSRHLSERISRLAV